MLLVAFTAAPQGQESVPKYYMELILLFLFGKDIWSGVTCTQVALGKQKAYAIFKDVMVILRCGTIFCNK